jgi:FtsP/CotA-like multicopper oxidase with cupredoxin domain
MNRRQFLASAAAMPMAAMSLPAMAQTEPDIIRAVTRQIEVKGRSAQVFGLVDRNGRPGWSRRAGEGFAVRLVNETSEPTGIHWHGPTPPWRQDGVPGVSMDPIPAGGSQEFRFPLDRPATHWMHSHLGLQKQALMAAPLIVRPASAPDEQEVVILLQDFSFAPADELLARLVGGPAEMAPHGGAAPHAAAPSPHGAMGGMGIVDRLRGLVGLGRRSMAMDINDIEFDAYLANDRTLDDPEVIAVERRGRVRLRVINGASATGFHLDLGSATGMLVAVDGEDLTEPLRVSTVPIAVAQRADILLDIPEGGGALPVLFRREGARERTGVILRPPGAAISRLDGMGDAVPAVGLELEARLRGPATPARATRTIVMPLTGDMATYRWGMGDGAPIQVRRGERLEIEMRNTTMMSHPMHLHGHHFQVVAIEGRRFAGALRDTVLVPPMQRVTIAFAAENPGPWPFHCHHLYHQVRGMETLLRYA